MTQLIVTVLLIAGVGWIMSRADEPMGLRVFWSAAVVVGWLPVALGGM